jgi:hypothetical protein
LTSDLVENICVPDVGHNRAFAREVSGGSAPEAGAWEHAHLGLVDVHWDDRWKPGRRKRGERDQGTRGCWRWEYTRCPDVLVQTMLEIQLLYKRVVAGRGCATVWYKVMVGSSCCISEWS